MEILPLGVGDAFAKTLFQTNFLVRPADGEPFLLDCGQTASRAMARLALDPRLAGRVVLSHLHADHIGGLEELGFTGRFRWGQRPVLWVPRSVLPFLWDHALMAGMGQRLRAPDGQFFEADLDTYFEVRPVVPAEPFAMGSVEVTAFPTPHTAGRPSVGYRLEDRATGGAVLLTCDSRFHRRNLERWGDGARAVFHDCQLVSNGSHIHTTLDELLTLEPGWQERIHLVHYADEWPVWEGRTGLMRFAKEGEAYRF
ncbi:MAG: MBL fold metallo-hydrolase [Deltaproteobacteria bacterium]|nr:MBL fold metallo-hydrolase [Deltaproteobacteria bacterium]